MKKKEIMIRILAIYSSVLLILIFLISNNLILINLCFTPDSEASKEAIYDFENGNIRIFELKQSDGSDKKEKEFSPKNIIIHTESVKIHYFYYSWNIIMNLYIFSPKEQAKKFINSYNQRMIDLLRIKERQTKNNTN